MRKSSLSAFLALLIFSQPGLAQPQASKSRKSAIADRLSVDDLLSSSFGPGPLISQNQGDNDQDKTPLLRQEISVSDTVMERKIDELTREILLKEFDLERYGIRYNMEYGKQGRWKGWRYGFWGEANLGLGLAGGIISVDNRGRKLRDASHVNVHTQESANYIPMIGNIIGAGAAGTEFGINSWNCYKASRKGYSPRKARKHVKEKREEIEKLLEQRAKLIADEGGRPELEARAKLDAAEQRVLKDLLTQTLQQFERFYLGKTNLLAFQQMQYLFDISKNVTSAVGYEYAYLSLARKHRIENGRAGVLFAVSGGLYMAGPVLSRLFAKMLVNRERNLLKPSTQIAENATLEQLKEDRNLLEGACKVAGCPKEKIEDFLDRSASIYALGEKNFEDEIARGKKALDKSKLVATQNIAAGAFVGGTKVASGILFMIPGFNARFNTSGHRADRATNSNLFTSSLISLPASTFAIIDTLRINIQGEVARQKLKKQGLYPDQLAQKRLDDLDRLEKMVKEIGL